MNHALGSLLGLALAASLPVPNAWAAPATPGTLVVVDANGRWLGPVYGEADVYLIYKQFEGVVVALTADVPDNGPAGLTWNISSPTLIYYQSDDCSGTGLMPPYQTGVRGSLVSVRPDKVLAWAADSIDVTTVTAIWASVRRSDKCVVTGSTTASRLTGYTVSHPPLVLSHYFTPPFQIRYATP